MPVEKLDAMEVLKKLVAARGVSGDEGEVRRAILEYVRPLADDVAVDALGSVIATKKGTNPNAPRVMLCAHMDEVGLMISGINENGTLRFKCAGSIDARVLVSKSVFVGDKNLVGVIGAKPIHLQEREEQTKPLRLEQLFIDIGAKDKKEAESAVEIGDYVVYDGRFVEFGEGFVKSKALDDRCGCAVLIKCLENTYESTVICVFAAQEEIGMRGARVASFRVKPDYALNFEGTTCADMPGVKDEEKVTRLGHGCALTMMDRSAIPHRGLRDFVVNVAKERNIPWQWRAGVFGGTDLGAIHRTGEGVPSMGLATPCRYIHSPASVMHKSDFEACIALGVAALEKMHIFHEEQAGGK